MIFRPSRARRTDDRFLNEKMLLFAVGALCGIVGMARDIGWLVYTGIAALALGLLLRVLSSRGSSQDGA